MSETYKCMVCGFVSETPGDHCGQPMVKQTTPESPTPSSTPAPATTESVAEAPSAEPTPTENAQNSNQ